jgi:aldehyde:ferredoxin oxidoreductase
VAGTRATDGLHGFHGRYWRFDLSRGEGELVALDASVLRRTLGGVGLGTWLLHREAPIGVDPLAPEAPLVFAFSPLVGTPITTSAKFAVVAKSPLTGGVSDALASSHFAIAGKQLGVDAIVLIGACAEPSELVEGRLRPSASWGRSATETAEALRGLGRVAAIGVAGERLVRFATISADGRHAGRGGLGAVMGAKRLKAIAVAGEQPTPVAHPERLAGLARQLRERAAGEATAKYRELGTVGNMLTFDRLGVLPTRNFQASHFAGAERLSAESLRPTRAAVRAACAGCTIGCEHRFAYGADSRSSAVRAGGVSRAESAASAVRGGSACDVDARRDGRKRGEPDAEPHAEPDSEPEKGRRETRAEYESLFALGPLLGIADPDIVLAASARCDELGLDTISVGGTLAFAMECGDRGLLADGPRFGDDASDGASAGADSEAGDDPGRDRDDDGSGGSGAALLRWLDDIAHRRGLGDRLAEGSRRLAEWIGQGSIDFAPQVKGLELPGYEPRSLQAMALGLAVGTRGADHNRSGAYEIDFSARGDRLHGDARAARMAVESEDRAALLDSLILCKFVRGALMDFYADSAALLSAVTGMDFDGEELRQTAARIVTLRKLFNLREGWQPADDTLPTRFLTEAIGSGPVAGARLPRARLEEMIRVYNRARSWTEAGLPTTPACRTLLSGLGLDQTGIGFEETGGMSA